MTKKDPHTFPELPTPTIRDSVFELAKLSAMLFETRDAINTKIDLIKQEISAGRYRSNSTHIATKLLACAYEEKTLESV